jgi:type II secretory pathway pseudopilin PulG
MHQSTASRTPRRTIAAPGSAPDEWDVEQGYAMVVLLIALSIMAVMMTIAMPVWKQMSQREKEEELVFRGQQYAHAIGLFQRKFANASPPNLDVLVEQHFLRKKYKDPITNDDFVPVVAGQATPGAPGGPAQPGARGGPGTTSTAGGPSTTGTTSGPSTTGAAGQPGASASPFASTFQAPTFGGGSGSGSPTTANAGATSPLGTSAIGTPGAGGRGGIIGVQSKSKDKSIRIYNGRTHYNEWAFVYTPQVLAPGAGGRGTTAPGQRGQPNPFGPNAPNNPNGPAQPGPFGSPTNPFGSSPFGSPNTPPGRGFGSPFSPPSPTPGRGGF